jgi:hypothetical protein
LPISLHGFNGPTEDYVDFSASFFVGYRH